MRGATFVGLAFLLTALAAVPTASAQDIVSEMKVGVLVHDAPIFGDQRGHGTDVNAELQFVSPVLASWIADVSPGSAAEYRHRREHVRLHQPDLFRPDLDGSHASLGSNVLFRPSAELVYWFNPRGNVSIYFEHSSNAGLASDNTGLDNIGVRLSVAFFALSWRFRHQRAARPSEGPQSHTAARCVRGRL
jgi:lipid A 3-O-deacylase